MRPRVLAAIAAAVLVAVVATFALTRGDDVGNARSSMWRWLNEQSPAAAWPLEDGPLVEAAAPMHGDYPLKPFVGTHPSGAVITYPRFGSGTLAPWLPQVLSRSGSAGLTILWAPVDMNFSTQWAVDFMYASGTDAAESGVDVNPRYLIGDSVWQQLTLDPANELVLTSFDSSPETSTSVPGLFDGRAHHIRWHAVQDGADIDWTVYVDGTSVQTGTETSATLAAISRIGFSALAQSGASIAMGYISVWDTPASVTDAAAAALGHTGETAAARFARLCTEAGVAYDVAS